MLWDVLSSIKLDVDLMCLSLCCFLSWWEVLRCVFSCFWLIYNLFCVVVDSVVVVSGCQLCLNCFSLR